MTGRQARSAIVPSLLFYSSHSFISSVALKPLPSGRGCEATPFGENDLWPEQIDFS